MVALYTDIKDTDPIDWRARLWDRDPKPDGHFTLKSDVFKILDKSMMLGFTVSVNNFNSFK